MDNVPAPPLPYPGPQSSPARRCPAQAARSSAGRKRSRRRKGRPLPRGGREKEGYGNAIWISIRLLSGASHRPCFRCPFVEKYSVVFEQARQGGEGSGDGPDDPRTGCDGEAGRLHEFFLFLLRRIAEPDEQVVGLPLLSFSQPHQERGMEPGEGPLPAEEIDFPHGCFLEERRDVRGVEQDDGGVSEGVQHRQVPPGKHLRLGEKHVGPEHDDAGEERGQVLPNDQADLFVRFLREDRLLLLGEPGSRAVLLARGKQQDEKRREKEDRARHRFAGRRNPMRRVASRYLLSSYRLFRLADRTTMGSPPVSSRLTRRTASR